MSVYIYDEALVEKIKNWTSSTDIRVYSPSDTRRLFEVLADTNNDKPIELPIICLRRNGGYQVLVPNRQPLSYDGFTTDATYEESIQINAVPISIQYQLDVYTRYFKEADEYTRNLVFNIINFPKLVIHIPYEGVNIEHDSAINMSNDVEDNSDIPERLITGQFTRFTINLELTDAYLWDIRKRPNVHIVGDDYVAE